MTVRINQRLREAYNPDGTPGTVSSGVAGVAGRPPTAQEVAAAVTTYLQDNPVTVEAITSSAREHNRFGAAAAGGPGSYVDIGTHGSLHGHVAATGTPLTVNLYLAAKGQVVTSVDHVVMGRLMAEDKLLLRTSLGSYIDVGQELAALGGSGTVPDFVAQFEAALTS